MSNCAPAQQPAVESGDGANDNNNNNDDGAVPSTSRADHDELAQGDNAEKGGKPKTTRKRQSQVEEYCERILNMSERDDDPVDLKLAALGAQIKRKLSDADDRDDLIFELEQVARQYFRAKKLREETVTVPARDVVSRPPPPLQPQPQPMAQAQAQSDGGLLDMGMLAQYNEDNIEYMRDPSGATFMKF